MEERLSEVAVKDILHILGVEHGEGGGEIPIILLLNELFHALDVGRQLRAVDLPHVVVDGNSSYTARKLLCPVGTNSQQVARSIPEEESWKLTKRESAHC